MSLVLFRRVLLCKGNRCMEVQKNLLDDRYVLFYYVIVLDFITGGQPPISSRFKSLQFSINP